MTEDLVAKDLAGAVLKGLGKGLGPKEALTVAEAAAHLGIHEKRLRRLLTRTEYRDRTQTGTRTTRTGERRVSLLSPDLLTDIEARLLLEADGDDLSPNGDNTDGDGDRDIGNGASPFGETGTEATGTRTGTRQVVMSAFYERLLLEKDARIGELAAALEHERAQGRRLAEALAREQTLRALPAPQEMAAQDHGPEGSETEASGSAPGETPRGRTALVDVPTIPNAPAISMVSPRKPQVPKLGWWERLWGPRINSNDSQHKDFQQGDS